MQPQYSQLYLYFSSSLKHDGRIGILCEQIPCFYRMFSLRRMAKMTQEELKTSENLFGWDLTPGIVSVWANREGLAIIWRREGDRVTSTRERFHPWLFATSLDDLAHLGSRLVPDFEYTRDAAAFTYRELDGPTQSYRYLLSANNGRSLERALVDGASRRFGRQFNSINELPDEY